MVVEKRYFDQGSGPVGEQRGTYLNSFFLLPLHDTNRLLSFSQQNLDKI